MARKTAALSVLVAEVLPDIEPGVASTLPERCLEAMRVAARQVEGRVIEAELPRFLAVFATARAAVGAAIAMQRAALALAQGSERGTASELVALGIGIHHGSVIAEQGKVLGDAVDLACALAKRTAGGRIAITGEVAYLLPSPMRQGLISGQEEPFASGTGTDVFGIAWREQSHATARVELSPESGSIVLSYRGIERVVGPGNPTLVIGRSVRADLQINDALVSREHLRVDLREAKVYFTDQSTNGTYVEIAGVTSLLRNEEMEVTGSGRLALGRWIKSSSESVRFYLRV